MRAEGEPASNGAWRDAGLRVPAAWLVSSTRISFSFDGVPVEALEGETIAAALAAAGIVQLGHRRGGAPRGVWCGMGVCQECIVTVDGAPSVCACMTKVAPDMVVATQGYAAPIARRKADDDAAAAVDPAIERPQVLVVGGGPAGLAAARALALNGAKVTILDERATPGGQYFKQIAESHTIVAPEAMDDQVREGGAAIAEVEALGVQIRKGALVWGAFGDKQIAATIGGAQYIYAPERLVLATGAYERGVSVPGWTLPGYMTTGAAQTLLRAYRVAAGRRVLVAGNGPLNLQLAAELVRAKVRVVALVEAAPRPGLRHALDFMRAACSAPTLVAKGVGYLAELRRANVPLLQESAVIGVQGYTRVQSCTIARVTADGRPVSGTSTHFDVDAVCVGYGFLPSNELARALGCRHQRDGEHAGLVTNVDADGLTSVQGVYAIGDAVVLRGAHVARHQGFITGCAVAQSLGMMPGKMILRELAAAKRGLGRHMSFQRGLWRIFAAPPLRNQFAGDDTIICRCENVARSVIDDALDRGATTLGAVKRRTRAGMGRCQGRYCESMIAAMLPEGCARNELSNFAPRPPSKPIRIKHLA